MSEGVSTAPKPAPTVAPEDDAARIARDSHLELARRSRKTAFIPPALAVLVLLGSGYHADHPEIIYPFIAVLCTAALLSFFRMGQVARRMYATSPRLAALLLSAFIVGPAALWGAFAAVTVGIYGLSYDAVVVVICIAGISAGGTTALSIQARVHAVFALSLLLPLTVATALLGTATGGATAAAFGLYTVFILLEGRHAARTYRRLVKSRMELERAWRAAQGASRAKTEFLATMSHEMRTPLNAVVGLTDLLRGTELSAEQRDFVTSLASSAESLTGVIDDILDISKIEAGRLTLSHHELSLQSVVAEVSRVFADEARSKGIALGFDVSAELPGDCWGDAQRLRQILLNLVGNGLKFTSEGSVDVRITSANNGGFVRFEVTDTGVGISAEAQSRIFGAFEQADGSTSRRHGGSGLGLAICKRLVGLMDGRIGVESAPGEGSTFWFEVPIAASARVNRASQNSPPAGVDDSIASHAPRLARARVLVVEDYPLAQKVMVRMLKKLVRAVDVASTGREAIDAVAEHDYDLIFMDCHLPEMDGFATTRKIRADGTLPSTVPIVAVTASATLQDRQECYDAGMNEFLSKPVREHSIRATLVRCLCAPAPMADGE